MTDHPSHEALELYTLGATSESDRAAIRTHLEGCVKCCNDAIGEIQLDDALAQVAATSRFCVACDRLASDDDRCGYCGTAVQVREYKVVEVRVQNAHGRLYRAVTDAGREVALKELCFHQPPSLATLEAFEREARFLRTLDHPRLPKFIASFTEGEGNQARLYLAQEFVAGESLESVLEHHYFTEAEILDIAQQVLDVLVYLQSLAPMVFHRDVKPANLIRRPDGSIALVDFGAARDDSATQGSTQVGTFGYMPVEQLAGLVDATTDGYALGASLLHLLSRRPPWQLLGDGFPKRINVSARVKKFLARLTAKKPEDRYVDARWALHAVLAIMFPPRRNIVLPIMAVAGTVGFGAYAGYEMRATELRQREEARERELQAPKAADGAHELAEQSEPIAVDATHLEVTAPATEPRVCTGSRCALQIGAGNSVVETGALLKMVDPPELTVEAWVKPQDHVELSWKDAVTISLAGRNFSASLTLPDGVRELHDVSWPPDSWRNVAVTYDGKTMKLYLDGMLAGTTTCTGNCRTPILRDGVALTGSGLVDEIQVWSVARTRDQVIDDMHPDPARDTTGLVTYFDFDASDRHTDSERRDDRFGNNQRIPVPNDSIVADQPH